MIGEEVVGVIREGVSPGLDRYRKPLPGVDVVHDVDRCLVAAVSSSEPVAVDRAAVLTTVDVYMPDGADVRASDRLRIRGVDDWAVDGDPAVWLGAGVVVRAVRKAG